MTCKEIGEYCEQQMEKEKNEQLVISSIGYRIGQLLINSNSFCVKRPKIIEFYELFPEHKERKQPSKEEQIEAKWKEFLGVVK